MGSCKTLVAEFKSFMMKEFEMSDLGVLQYFLGLQKMVYFVSQTKYAKNLLFKFGMHNCKAAVTPMNAHEKFQLKMATDLADPSHYRSLIGGLNYLTHTRPDIMFSAYTWSYQQHLGAVRRVLRYVAGTVDFGTWYSKDADFSLSDSDWAGSIDNRKSTSGNVFNLGSGRSKKQDVVTLSSSKAEYVAVTSAACQALFL
uniref:Reverse transcriptase Ty1/copia-type domain-containing protein n=1 Tax=Solanum lycopersicum TaxID=4081 RepID=A0A3Q7I494_SOLLC